MAGFEVRESEKGITTNITLSQGEGLSTIATRLGIRELSLKTIPNLGTLREGDVFALTRNSDGSGIMKKVRNKVSPGERKINEGYPLSKEAIYQDIEKGPENFPHIQFRRIPESHIYELVDVNGKLLLDKPLTVFAGNLEALRNEIGKKGGVFLTKCGTTLAMHELSCEITPNSGHNSAVDLRSKSWYNFFSSPLELEGIQRLLVEKNPSIDIAQAMTQSLFPRHTSPDAEVAALQNSPIVRK